MNISLIRKCQRINIDGFLMLIFSHICINPLIYIQFVNKLDSSCYRSYLEMEKQFKVFVYEEGEPPVFHDGPCKSIYSMEGNFIYTMEVNGQFRTKDPEKAHVFFLPFSVAKMVQFVYVRDSHDFGPMRRTVVDYVNLISSRYPYWNRSLGADHFMLACHDWVSSQLFALYSAAVAICKIEITIRE